MSCCAAYKAAAAAASAVFSSHGCRAQQPRLPCLTSAAAAAAVRGYGCEKDSQNRERLGLLGRGMKMRQCFERSLNWKGRNTYEIATATTAAVFSRHGSHSCLGCTNLGCHGCRASQPRLPCLTTTATASTNHGCRGRNRWLYRAGG
jgi:hypothetical protein